MSVRCIGPVFTEDKRGASGSPEGGGLAWGRKSLKLDGEVGDRGGGRMEEEEEGVCLSVHYI